jgi:hypothetical protein
MGPEAILLSVLHGGREGTYRFTCPTCLDGVEKRADRKIVALLVSAGVDVSGRSEAEDRTMPMFEEVAEPDPDPRGQLPEGPAFTIDDLIDFHFVLQDDGRIREFLAGQR